MLFCYLNVSSFGHWELFIWLLYPWHMLIIVSSVSLFGSYLLLSIAMWYSRLTLCPSCPVLESAMCPRSPGSFYWRMVLETMILVLSMLLLVTFISYLTQGLTHSRFSLNMVEWLWVCLYSPCRQGSYSHALLCAQQWIYWLYQKMSYVILDALLLLLFSC